MNHLSSETRPVEATLRVAQGLSGAENRSLTFPKSTTNLARQNLPMGTGIEVASVPGALVQPAAVGDAPLPPFGLCVVSPSREGRGLWLTRRLREPSLVAASGWTMPHT